MPLNIYIQHRGKTITGGIHQPCQPLHYHVLFSLQKERLDKCNNCTAQSSFTCLRTKYKAHGAIQTIMGSKISATLNWVDHANTITKNAISCLGFLRGNLQGCPRRQPIFPLYNLAWSIVSLFGIHTSKRRRLYWRQFKEGLGDGWRQLWLLC